MIKFRKYIVLLCLFSFLENCVFVKEVFAKKKKSKLSRRRSASSSKSSRRRSVASSRASKRRSMAAGRRSVKKSKKQRTNSDSLNRNINIPGVNNTSSDQSSLKEIKTDIMCPMNKVLRKDLDNEEIYFYKKQACIAPFISEEHNLNSNINLEQQLDLIKPNWLEEDQIEEAVYLTCPKNYILSYTYSWEHILKKEKIDKFESNPPCISMNKFCPLNEPLEERSGKLFKMDGVECVKIKGGAILKDSEGDMMEGGASKSSIKFMVCDNGFYPRRVGEKPAITPADARDSNSVEPVISCIHCPRGYTSDGNICTKITTISDCKAGDFFDKDKNECIPCTIGFWCNNGIKNQCPVEREFSNPKSTKESDCEHQIAANECKPGTYLENGNCNDCPVGSWCSEGIKHECPEDRKFSETKSVNENACMSFNSNCKAGYKCTANGNSEICPAGTFAKAGDVECTPCQNYYWSNKGSEKCNKIMIKIRYGNGRGIDAIYDNLKWFWSNSNVHCDDSVFGDPIKGQKKYCGFSYNDFAEQYQTFKLNCKKIPCTIKGNSAYSHTKVKIDEKGDATLYKNNKINEDLESGINADLEGMASWDGSHDGGSN